MNEEFLLPVEYKGKELQFPAVFQTGYTYGIEVDIDGKPALLKKDEERNWHVIFNGGAASRETSVEVGLLRAIMQSIDTITK